MRLLVTTDVAGGVWTYSAELVRGLLQQEAAVALVTLGGVPSVSQKRWLEQTASWWGSSFSWHESPAPLEWMNDNERAYRDAESLLLRVAQEFGAELLHLNQFCYGALPVRIPKLIAAHSDVLSWSKYSGHAIEPCAWLERYCDLTCSGLNGCDAVVAPTRWMLTALGESFSLPSDRFVVPNGRSVPSGWPESPRTLQAITAGRLWDPAKNLAMLADAELPIPLLVAGAHSYQANAAPELPAGATALGSLAESELLAHFRQCAIYVCSSLYEPFGLAPLEAALCGCAVVAKDLPSLREVWGTGALYFQNVAELRLLLQRLVDHPRQLISARKRSWQRARKYTGQRMTMQYLKIYQTMLAKHGAASHVA
jgi:glycogen synthase